jgi:hypothetical protein
MTTPDISTSWHSYPKSLALGHRYVVDILRDPVTVEEKVDGSQFSFGVFNGELKCRSKGSILNLIAPEKMFIAGIETAKALAPILKDGWTYRGEYLMRPKHNALAYERTPEKHIIGFDINPGHEQYLPYEEKAAEFSRIGLETVPCIHSGEINDIDQFRTFLDRISVLGGQKIEGVVIKNYKRFTDDGKVMMAKFVSEAFKEVHRKSWVETNPGQGDILDQIIAVYKTPARWSKAIQHLRENGLYKGTPEDIGNLIKRVREDTLDECRDEMIARVWGWAEAKVMRGLTGGLPEWYKEQLMKEALETAHETEVSNG